VGIPFAEVIGDPVAHSRSPAIHKGWLAELGIEGDFRATRVAAGELDGFLAGRRGDPDWRGCSVTIPHKRPVMRLLDRIDPRASAVGAVNCVVPGPDGLSGHNKDLDGLTAALGRIVLEGRKVALIGTGGAARAAIRYLLDSGVGQVAVLARDPSLVERLGGARPLPLEACDSAFQEATAIVNATPMGMTGASAMPPWLLASVAAHSSGTILFDMVYEPAETPFLATGRANGAKCIGGLTMLVGQARAAFELFFGRAPPLA
jgi:shikimate dehydrogenase